MDKRAIASRQVTGLVLLVVLVASAAHGAGFGIFEHGSKAMGMAGAFTAQADDPSAMFHNVGGLAFLDERQFAVGTTYITNSEADFTGADPFPGSGLTAEQETLTAFPPHAYWVEPLSSSWNFGLAINSPFGLTTEWKDPDQWVGRFISTKAELLVVDINPNLGVKVSPNFGFGFGPIVRFSKVELNRRQAAINPFTLLPAEVARVKLESDFDEGFGWQAGFLHKINSNVTWGLSYRSPLEIEFGGDARFTQVSTGNPVFDGLVATLIPFDRDLPIATEIEFPDMASLGVALRLTQRVLMEVDVNWAGWSTFDTVIIDFESEALEDQELPQNWDDSYNYRLGVRFTRSPRSEWRFGYVLDESPQPDEGVGPLLPDSERDGFTIGYGRRGGRVGVDLALMYLPFDDRTTLTNRDNFNGTYETTAWLFGATVSW